MQTWNSRSWSTRALWLSCVLGLRSGANEAVFAQSLTRGPYLQNGSTTAVTIRWRTSANAASIVRYGTSAGNLNLSVSDNTVKTEHELRITGLTPNTQYRDRRRLARERR